MTNSTESPKSNRPWFSSRLFYAALILVALGLLYNAFRGVEQTVLTKTQYIQLQGRDRLVKTIQFKYRNVYHRAVQQDAQLAASTQIITQLLEERDSLQTALNKRLHLKPKVYTKVIQEFQLPKVDIPYRDTARYALSDSLVDYLRQNPERFVLVPKEFEKDSTLFVIKGQVHARGVTIDSLVVPNELAIQVAHARKNFLAPYRSTVTALNTNPLVQHTLTNTVVVQTPKPRIHLGLQAGYGISLVNFKPGPYLGVGVSYQPF